MGGLAFTFTGVQSIKGASAGKYCEIGEPCETLDASKNESVRQTFVAIGKNLCESAICHECIRVRYYTVCDKKEKKKTESLQF